MDTTRPEAAVRSARIGTIAPVVPEFHTVRTVPPAAPNARPAFQAKAAVKPDESTSF
jgi:hypothetical protein